MWIALDEIRDYGTAIAKLMLPRALSCARSAIGDRSALGRAHPVHERMPDTMDTTEAAARYGALGVGAIAAAMVPGLCEGVRAAPTILGLQAPPRIRHHVE